ncbi:hypothetical protein T06_15605 [Trichinella sp. T6]|nr:hypothetical protein T06_15605 [Trichinella sp. T6]
MPFLSGTSVVSLIIRQITLRQSSSVRIYSANVLVVVAFSAFPICVLRLLMKPVMLPTCVHLEFMAFPSRSTVPLLIINMRNCEDESCILNDRYRITYKSELTSLLCSMAFHSVAELHIIIARNFSVASTFIPGLQAVGNIPESPLGHSVREYANFYLPWGIAWGYIL